VASDAAHNAPENAVFDVRRARLAVVKIVRGLIFNALTRRFVRIKWWTVRGSNPMRHLLRGRRRSATGTRPEIVQKKMGLIFGVIFVFLHR
jgi:hypothetical protein